MDRRRVTCGYKANIDRCPDGLFPERFRKVAREMPRLDLWLIRRHF